jgi:beta-glucosidase
MGELYKDKKVPAAERAGDLLSQMTLEEKCQQLCCVSDNEIYGTDFAISPDRMKENIPDGIGGLVLYPKTKLFDVDICRREIKQVQEYLVNDTRLGIPAMPHTEALSGPWIFGATNYPEPVGLAGTWNPELVQEMADAIRSELRAIGFRQVLSPVMDITRDPRWGRVGESYGEDPYLSSAMAVAYVKGIQGQGLSDGILASAKHFLGYGFPVAGLNMGTQQITSRELFEVYARPFDACIHLAGLYCVMNSYGNIDGIPINESYEILTELLRHTMGFEGFVVSDYHSIERSYENFHTADSIKQAGINSFNAGLDMELPKRIAYGDLMVKAIKEGSVKTELLDASVSRVLNAKFRLGLFENPYPEDEEKCMVQVLKPEHKSISMKLASQSLILLKNEGPLLPLSKDIKRLAIIGPCADSLRVFFAGYSAPAWIDVFIGDPQEKLFPGMESFAGEYGIKTGKDTPSVDKENYDAFVNHGIEYGLKNLYPDSMTILEAIRSKLGANCTVKYSKGCDLNTGDCSKFDEAAALAEWADVTVMVMGGQSGWGRCATTGEGIDSVNIGYFGVQEELIRKIYKIKRPMALVEVSSRPVSSPWTEENLPAILHCAAPGAFGSQAVADALFGDANPAGKLPLTVARHVGQVPIYYNQSGGSSDEDNSIGFNTDGYIDMTKYPLYYFGHGLSYSLFEYADLIINPGEITTSGTVTISFRLTNTSNRTGTEISQLYIYDELSIVIRPVKQLMGFARVELKAGESAEISFSLSANELGFYDRNMRFIVEPGFFQVMIGSSSKDIRLKGRFKVMGTPKEIMQERTFLTPVSVHRH